MFAKIAYKQNINMWKTNFSLQHLKLLMGTKLFFRPKTIFANNVLLDLYFFNLAFRNLKFPVSRIAYMSRPSLSMLNVGYRPNVRSL